MITLNDVNYFPIPGWPMYFISKSGNVYSQKVRKILKQQTAKKGYKRITLMQKSGKKTLTVHRLVLLTFVGKPPPNLPEIRHKNSNPADNRLENLEYCTAQQNTDDKYFQNRRFQKLTALQAQAIARDRRPYKEIAKEYGLSRSSVSDIKCGLVWAKVTEGIRFKRGFGTTREHILEKFTMEQINFICDRNYSRSYISEKQGIPIWVVKKIRRHFKPDSQLVGSDYLSRN